MPFLTAKSKNNDYSLIFHRSPSSEVFKQDKVEERRIRNFNVELCQTNHNFSLPCSYTILLILFLKNIDRPSIIIVQGNRRESEF